MTLLPRLVADNPRMGSALLGSMAVHLAALFLVALYFNQLQTRRAAPSELSHPLLARLVAVTRTETPKRPPEAKVPAPVTRPAAEPRPGAVISQPGPGLESPAAVPETVELAVTAEHEARAGEPGPPFGVRVVDLLFQGPFPSGFVQSNPLLKGQGYIRDADLDDRPEPIVLVLPEYPDAALAKRLAGMVVIAFFLDEKGRVIHVSPVESSEEFQPFEAGFVATLRQSTFTPGKVKGKPVRSISILALRFNPDGWPDPARPADAPVAGPN